MASPGVRFANELQKSYRPNDRVSNITYEMGIIEAMTQTEALRLAMEKVPFEKLTRADVLNYGFFRIKNLDTGDLSSSPLTYGPDRVQGVDKVRMPTENQGLPQHLAPSPGDKASIQTVNNADQKKILFPKELRWLHQDHALQLT